MSAPSRELVDGDGPCGVRPLAKISAATMGYIWSSESACRADRVRRGLTIPLAYTP